MSREQIRAGMSWLSDCGLSLLFIGMLWPINLLVALCQGGGSAVIELCGPRAMLMIVGACVCIALGIVFGILGAWWTVGAALIGYLFFGGCSFYYTAQDGRSF